MTARGTFVRFIYDWKKAELETGRKFIRKMMPLTSIPCQNFWKSNRKSEIEFHDRHSGHLGSISQQTGLLECFKQTIIPVVLWGKIMKKGVYADIYDSQW